MSKVVTTTVLPDVAGGSVTLGGTGDSVVVTGNDLRANILQDAGGNAMFTSNGSGVLSGMNSAFAGAMKLIQTQTASNSASVSFTSGLDSTYDVYIFKFIDINPATVYVYFTFQMDTAAGSSYNTSMTTTQFGTHHKEFDGGEGLNYQTAHDQANGTDFQYLQWGLDNASDASLVGELHLFNPSSTTYVKHFHSTTQQMGPYDDPISDYRSLEAFTAGYFNTTSALTKIQFKMSSGNFDGIIKLYGISKS